MQKKAYVKNQGGLYIPHFPYTVIFRGLLFSYVLTIILICIVSLVLYFSPLAESIVPYIIFGITLVCIVWGSAYVGKRVDEKGWLRGGITGLLYVAFLMALSFIFLPDLSMGTNVIYRFVIGFSFGALGGILGINA